MKNNVSSIRPSLWDEESPAEEQFRQVRQRESGAGKVLPGMPLEFDDADQQHEARFRRPRFRRNRPLRPWWRPASKAGRFFFGLSACTALAGLIVSGLALKTCLERDARFRISGEENIQTSGLTEVSRAQILSVFGEDIGRNIFFVPIGERRRQLEEIPWVQQATVMRLLPDRIRASIVERQPVAFTRQGNRICLVDASGVLLSMSPAAMARHHYSFPVLTGIDPGDTAEARRARVALYLRLMNALDSTGQHYSRQISEIDLTDPEDARALMPEQGTDILAHFGDDNFLERYLRYQAYVAEWRRQYPRLAAVDLRYEQQVVLEMASGAQASDSVEKKKPEAGELQAAPHSPRRQAGRAGRRQRATRAAALTGQGG